MPDTDVAVIGAGPGGSACAAALAERGYDVTLIDQHEFPRDKPCGDGLTPDAVTALKRLGLETFLDGCLQISGCRVIGDHRRERVKRFTGTRAVCVPRTRLDKALLDTALDRGARFVKGRALGSAPSNGRDDSPLRLTGDRGASGVAARRVVASDGATSAMRRSAGLGTPGHAVRSWAIRGYYATERALDDVFAIYVPLEVRGTITVGYGWVFPIAENVANIGVGYLRPRGTGRMPRLNEALDAFVDELRLREHRRYGDVEPLGRSTGSPIGVNFDPGRGSAGNLILIGDAAGTTDPLTGEGIGPALRSAAAGARCVSESLERGASLSACGRELGRRMPRAGQDMSSIARLVASREGGVDFAGSKIKRLGFLSSALEMATDSARPDPRATAVAALLRGMGGPAGARLDACADRLLDAIRTTFPLMTPVIARELRSGAGPVLSATLICAMGAAGEGTPRRDRAGAVAVECLAPFPTLIGRASQAEAGRVATLNNALAILTADFTVSRALVAAAEISPGATVRFARTVRELCQGGLMDATDRYDLDRTRERLLDAVEYRVGAAFAFAAELGAELSGASPATAAAMSRFGSQLGVAHHLAEAVVELEAIDETDLTVDTALRQGIYSLPVLLAAQDDRDVWKALTRGVEIDELPGLVASVRETGAIDRTEALASARLDAARAALAGVEPERSDQLRLLADWVGSRASGARSAAVATGA